jgi:type I restriction enzyme, S subunit
MTEWREVALGDGVRIHHGYAFKGEFFSGHGNQILLTPGNFIDSGGFKPKSGAEKYYTGPIPDGYLLRRGDVVIAMTEQAAGLLGSSATIPDGGRYLHNQRIGLIEIIDPDLVDLRFVYHLMNSPAVRDQISATATGAKVRHTAPERIRSVRVRIPSIATQRVVGGMLDAVDEFIENNRRRVEVLEDMARAIYREWFVHFHFPGHENVELVNSDLGLIPDGWAWGAFGELVDIGKDTVDPATIDPTTPAVGLEHIPRRRVTLDDWAVAAAQGSRKAQFKQGDVLFGKIRPYFHKVSVAPLGGICSTDAFVMRPKSRHWGQAVAVASSDEFVANAVQTSNGTKMPRADWKVISKWPVPIPPSSISESFTGVMQDHLGLAAKLMFESRKLAAMRELLLPKLITGQIDVSELDLDVLVVGAVA